MRMKGSYIIGSVLRGANAVVMLGPVVLKRLGGHNASRRYYSELAARRILTAMGVGVVPIVGRIGVARTLVMRRAASTLNRVLTRERLVGFGNEVITAAGRHLPPDLPAGYYWVDSPRRRRAYETFTDFLIGEFTADQRAFELAYPTLDSAAVIAVFRAAAGQTRRTLVLTDVAPKNVVYENGRYAHLDLEVTLVGPPEFLLVKAAVNLATDIGGAHDARTVRRTLLDACASPEYARAAVAFTLTRRLLYESRANRRDTRPVAALEAVLEGRDLNDAIACLEAEWDSRPVGMTSGSV